MTRSFCFIMVLGCSVLFTTACRDQARETPSTSASANSHQQRSTESLDKNATGSASPERTTIAQSSEPTADESPHRSAAPPTTGNDSDPTGNTSDADAKRPSTRQLVEQYDDAVVYLTAQDPLGNDVSFGSGFIIDESGLVATNYHIIRVGSRVKAQTKNGEFLQVAGYRAADPKRDLIILQLEQAPQKREVFQLDEPEALQTGDELVAIGHPQGFRFTASTGIVSAVRRMDELPNEYRAMLSVPDDTVWIQTNAAISAGSSGGPLLNREGALVGVNTWVAAGQNLGFATHVQHLRELRAQIHDLTPLPVRRSPGYYSYSEPEVADLLHSFSAAIQKYSQDARNAQQGGFLGAFRKPKNPTPAHAEKLWSIAEAQRGKNAAFEALNAIITIAAYDDGDKEYLQKTVGRLRDDHLLDSALDKTIVFGMSLPGNALLPLLRDAAQTAEDRDVKGLACYALAHSLSTDPHTAYENSLEVITYLERAINEYGDVPVDQRSLKDVATARLVEVKHKSPGRTPLPLSGKDLDGTELSLQQLKGRVVLLDFWADWCPHCRVMYPLERQLQEKYKSRAFSILGVNADEKDRYQRIRDAGEVAWPSIYDGPNGPIIKQWQIDHFPNIFLLDKHGQVRAVDARDEALQEEIERLMDEFYYPWQEPLVAFGSTWRYLDEWNAPTEGWEKPEFDDGSWKEGAAPFGYGHFDETSPLTFGQDPLSKPITSYYRHRFQVTDPSAVNHVLLHLECDSGAVIYLNGQEILRTMLAIDASHDSVAVQSSGTSKMVYLAGSCLKNGENVLAVELHQASPQDPTARLDLCLIPNAVDQLLITARDANAIYRTEAIMGLGYIGPDAAVAVADLEAMLNSDDVTLTVNLQQALALIQAETRWQHSLPSARNEQEVRKRMTLAATLHVDALRSLVPRDQSPHQYNEAWRMAFTANHLVARVPMVEAICGLAQLRIGKSAEAVTTLEKSIQERGPTPLGYLACALAKYELNLTEEAKKDFEQAKSLMMDGERQYAEIQRLYEQASELFDNSPVPTEQ